MSLLDLWDRNNQVRGRDSDPRRTDFRFVFDEIGAARLFADDAEREGCSVVVAFADDDLFWRVTASTLCLKSEIDEWMVRLDIAAQLRGGYCERLDQPRAQSLRFYADGSQRDAAETRASVLFNNLPVRDPLEEWLIGKGQPPTEFTLVPSAFLARARRTPPTDRRATASAFAQWVYSLYRSDQGSDEDKTAGLAAEEDIWERRRSAYSCVNDAFLQAAGSRWRLAHNGLHLVDGQPVSTPMRIEGMQVDGSALLASPDLVYVNDRDNEVLIVEIKHSAMPVSRNLWPNVWAQLWCYAHVPEAIRADRVTVVGEVWGTMRNSVEKTRTVVLRRSVRRNPRAPAYDRFFRELFEIYRG